MNIDPKHFSNASHEAVLGFLKTASVFALIIMACVIAAMSKGCERAEDHEPVPAIPLEVNCPAQFHSPQIKP